MEPYTHPDPLDPSECSIAPVTRKEVIDGYPELFEMMIDTMADDASCIANALKAIRLNHDVLRRTFSEKDIKEVQDRLYNFHESILRYVKAATD